MEVQVYQRSVLEERGWDGLRIGHRKIRIHDLYVIVPQGEDFEFSQLANFDGERDKDVVVKVQFRQGLQVAYLGRNRSEIVRRYVQLLQRQLRVANLFRYR